MMGQLPSLALRVKDRARYAFLPSKISVESDVPTNSLIYSQLNTIHRSPLVCLKNLFLNKKLLTTVRSY